MRIAAAIAALLLAGCVALDAAYDRAHWVRDGMDTGFYTWTVVNNEAPCGVHFQRGAVWGCAVRMILAVPQPGAKPVPGATVSTGHCFIYSNAPESEAPRVLSRDGDDLWSHELRHCRGWRHPR